MTGPTLEERAALLTGRDLWSTQELPGVPSLVLTDGPHGVRRQEAPFDQLSLSGSLPATCFPPAVAVGNSWDPEVAEQVGAAVGREARAQGVHVVLGPGVNLKRSPLCGRTFEYYSEDPLLAGVLGAAHVRGQQGEGVGASVKHFAANNQETDRMQVSADVDERTLRELYLPAFERVVREARPATVMCAYNRVNGVHASQSRWLLTEVLREQWGFDGVVVSDWGAVHDRVAALQAGLDLEMPATRRGPREVVAAVREGRLDEAVVDTAVARVTALAGLAREPGPPVDPDAHHALARRLAAQCAVLLKNDDDLLPLSGAEAVAVLGPFADDPRVQGGGSSRVACTRVDSPRGELARLLSERGGRVVEDPAACDVAVLFLGLPDDDESEGADRTHLDLPADQLALLAQVAAVAPRTVVVLLHGGVVVHEAWHDDADAVLDGALLGQAAGGALADLLLGVEVPSGHLGETVPLRLQDTPAFPTWPGEQGHARYGEGVLVGYRWYTTVERPVRYPFGHGLSYTTFATEQLDVALDGPDTATVTVRVRNTGPRAGAHVVQVYVATTAGPVRRPVRELRAFAKVRLDPGEVRDVVLPLDRRAFAHWDAVRGDWVVARGTHVVQVGQDAHTVLREQALELPGDPGADAVTMSSTLGAWLEHPAVGPALRAELAGLDVDPALLRAAESMPMDAVVALAGDLVDRTVLDRLMTLSAG